MVSVSEQLNQFGWDEWFDAKAQEKILAGHRVARVVAVDREQLLVIDPWAALELRYASPAEQIKIHNPGLLTIYLI